MHVATFAPSQEPQQAIQDEPVFLGFSHRATAKGQHTPGIWGWCWEKDPSFPTVVDLGGPLPVTPLVLAEPFSLCF